MPLNSDGNYFSNPKVGQAHAQSTPPARTDHAQPQETSDSITGYLRGLSERVFNWSDADHKQAAEYADQRAQELRESQKEPHMLQLDLSGHIKQLEDTANYHRSLIKNQPVTQADGFAEEN